MGEDTANASGRSARISVWFVCCCFYLHFCFLVVLIMFYRFFNCYLFIYFLFIYLFIYLFISNNCSFNVHADIEASNSLSMA